MDIIVKAKGWGNSLGVILPAKVVKKECIKVGEEIVIRVEKNIMY